MGELVLAFLLFVSLFFIISAVNMAIWSALNIVFSDDDSSFGLMVIDSLLITILLVVMMSLYLV